MRLSDLIANLQAYRDGTSDDPKVMVYSEDTESWHDILSIDHDAAMGVMAISYIEGPMECEIESLAGDGFEEEFEALGVSR